MLVEACASIYDAWLRADAANVVAVHCAHRPRPLRRAALAACSRIIARRAARARLRLCLSVLAQLRGENVLTLPSDRRYLHYFGAVLGGSRPVGRLELRSLMLNGCLRSARRRRCIRWDRISTRKAARRRLYYAAARRRCGCRRRRDLRRRTVRRRRGCRFHPEDVVLSSARAGSRRRRARRANSAPPFTPTSPGGGVHPMIRAALDGA